MFQYLFTTKQNKMASFIIIIIFFFFSISVKGIAAPNVLFVSGKLNFANDSVLFSA